MSFAGSSGSGGFTPASAAEDPPTVHRSGPATPPIRRLAGRFLLEQQLRAASGADIWLAVDEKLNRAVAVYLMASGAPGTAEVLSAARLAAGVPDTRFVQVLDAVDDGSSAYVVTEWLTDAVDLGTRLASGPMPGWEAVSVASEVAEAMACAHASGLTHQRLDPYNVLRTESGQVKIHGLRLEATLSGLVPASADEARVADVRGIGALLYACLTAHWPYGEAYGLASAPQDALGPATPAALRPDVAPDVDSVTMRLLSAGIPLAEATPPPAPGEEDEETAAVPRLPLASCDEAVEALSGLRRSRPQPQTPPRPGYPDYPGAGSAPGPATGYGEGYRTEAYGTTPGGSGPGGPGYPNGAYGGYPGQYPAGSGYGAPGYPPPGPDQPYGDRSYRDQAYADPGYPDHPYPDGPGQGGGQGQGQDAGRRRMAMAAVGLLAVAGVGLLGWKMMDRGTPAPKPTPSAVTSSSAPSATPIRPVTALPFPSPNEHAGTAQNTIEGIAPAWTTYSYKDGPPMKIKHGTGILYDLGSVRTVSSVTAVIGHATGANGSQAVLQLRAAGEGVTSADTVTEGGLTLVDTKTPTGTDVTFKVTTPVKTRFVLVWFTSLPEIGGSGGGGPYRDTISKVTVLGSS